MLGVHPGRLLRLRQVHGTRVIEASGPTLEHASQDDWPEADAAISVDPTVGLAVRVADCVPLLMADRRSGAVAAAHAGWRGLAAGTPVATVSTLGQLYGVRPADLVAAVGPSIGPCCYVVGPELLHAFAGYAEAPHWFVEDQDLRLDLWRATRDQLRRAGLEETSIHIASLCTTCHSGAFCSFRRDKEHAGRMTGVIKAVRIPQPPGSASHRQSDRRG